MTKNNEIEVIFPKESLKLAEFIGIILGDGNSNRIRTENISSYTVKIVGHIRNDHDYLLNYVNPLTKELFGISFGFYEYKNTLRLTKGSKQLVSIPEYYGLPPGNKKKSNIGIPSWIFKNNKMKGACLRGLIDTDGCVYKCGNGSLFPRINFCSKIEQLKTDFRELVISLGFHPTPWNGKNIIIYRKKDIFKYWEEIGFSNLYHKKRFKAVLLSSRPV